MTINIACRAAGFPVLISDYLISGAGDRVHIPTAPIADYTVSETNPIGLTRKAVMISSNFVVTGCGSGSGVTRSIARLYASFEGEEVDSASLTQVLTNILDLRCLAQRCTLVGWIVDNSKSLSFRWRSQNPKVVEFDGEYVEGSGYRLYKDLKLYKFMEGSAKGAVSVENAIHIALHQVGTLLGNEFLSANTVADNFGGGFEIFVFDGYRFQIVPEVTFLIFSLELQKDNRDNSVQYWIPLTPIVSKWGFIGDYAVVRTLALPNNLGIPDSTPERTTLIPPLLRSKSVPLPEEVMAVPFQSERYVCIFVGESALGEREISTMIAWGEEAKKFRIYSTGHKNDDLDEIRFELPKDIIKNMVAEAVRWLERDGTRLIPRLPRRSN